MMRTDYQRIHLENLRDGFGIDVEPAQHLSGDALTQWLNDVEDAWCDAALKERADSRATTKRGDVL